jgi:hypothetical protein
VRHAQRRSRGPVTVEVHVLHAREVDGNRIQEGRLAGAVAIIVGFRGAGWLAQTTPLWPTGGRPKSVSRPVAGTPCTIHRFCREGSSRDQAKGKAERDGATDGRERH